MNTRRLNYRAAHWALALAATAAAVLATLAAQRHAPRLDATLTAEHRLAPRTRAVLDGLPAPHELILAADLSGADRWAREQVLDVVTRMDDASEALRVTTIDTGAAGGLETFDALLARLAQRDAAALNDLRQRIDAARALMDDLPPRLAAWSDALLTTRDLLPAETFDASRRAFDAWAAAVRLHAEQLATAGQTVDALLAERIGRSDLPPLDRAATAAGTALRALSRDLAVLARELAAFVAEPRVPAEARDPLIPVNTAAAVVRDDLARRADALQAQRLPEALRIARAVESGQAAFVLGPPGAGATAVPAAELLAPSALAGAMGAARADVRRRAEDLLATAVSAVATPDRPIVVLAHAEARPFIADTPVFEGLLQRLGLRGIDLLEWATLTQPDPPPTTDLDPAGTRPVVFVLLSPDAAARAQGTPEDPTPSGADRAAALAATLADLLARGEAVLVNLNPSVLPSFGGEDPLARALAPLGLEVDSGTPVLAPPATPDGGVRTDLPARSTGEHPLARALRGLPVLLPWAVPMRLAEGAAAEGVLQVDAGEGRWAERQWIRLWSTPREQRGLLSDAPAPDERDGPAGPWTVAAALQRSGPAFDAPQRVLVVGSNTWFVDAVAERRDVVDGRLVLLHPGNAELFDNAIEWLAGRDALVAPSPAARAIALIGPIEPDALRTLRFGLVIGLPMATLGLGVLWRLARG